MTAHGAPPMSGDALAAVKDLDGGRGQAGVDVLVQEGGGDGVVMAVELDVVVDVDAGTNLPVAVDEGLGGERAERGLIELLEERAATGAVEPHRPRVEIREQLGDPRIERREGEKGLVPEAGEDPPRGHQNSGLHFGLIPWLRGSGGQDDRAVVLRELVVRPLHAPARSGTGSRRRS